MMAGLPRWFLAVSWIAVAGCNQVLGLDETRLRDASVDASAAVCQETAEPKTDPTGRSWTTTWYCMNTYQARIYADANRNKELGYLETVRSWFLCYRRGAAHEGGNDVWYYTQGDHPAPGPWGYVAAVDVQAASHPYPGMAPCD